jgi:hypothetical protein
MKRWIFGLAALVLLSSCADFFTNSWGKNSVRDPGTIKVTSDNVGDILKEAKGDTKTSRGILGKIKDQVAGNPNADPGLQAAAAKAAAQASGLGQAAVGAMGKVDDLLESSNANAFTDLLSTIQNDVKGNDLKGIASDITASLPVNASGAPVFQGNFIKSVSDSDLTILTLTMVLAEGETAGGFNNYITGWTDGNKKIDGSGNISLSSSERVIAAAVNELASRPNNDLGKMLKDLLEKGN